MILRLLKIEGHFLMGNVRTACSLCSEILQERVAALYTPEANIAMARLEETLAEARTCSTWMTFFYTVELERRSCAVESLIGFVDCPIRGWNPYSVKIAIAESIKAVWDALGEDRVLEKIRRIKEYGENFDDNAPDDEKFRAREPCRRTMHVCGIRPLF